MTRDEIETLATQLLDAHYRRTKFLAVQNPGAKATGSILRDAADALRALADERDAARGKLTPWEGVIDRITSIERGEVQVTSPVDHTFMVALALRATKKAEAERDAAVQEMEAMRQSGEWLKTSDIDRLMSAADERDAALAREARRRVALRWIAETCASGADWPGGAEEEASSYASHARAALDGEGKG